MYRDYLQAVVFVGGVLFTSLINTVVKIAVARQRPSINIGANAEGYSFPSGHSAVAIVCYGLLTYFLMKKVASITVRRVVFGTSILLVLLIGISRYFINVHYLTDILTGFFLGGMVFVASKRLYEKSQIRRSRS
ncbi:phosphatase PAP2 family protein [Virgibacillus halophilus]|uniref:Phosphatase PAP2 family protein n=2 Tax=Tigheibacillus halophilus TaxID=361280 RepID=A0ABU5C9L3_9BACI|nr:phosphatase PAP2 family protein [Virgibacillus halophilus]